MDAQLTDMAFREQLDDPQITEALARLLGRAKDVERLVDRASVADGAIDGLLATATDVIDEQSERINATGTSVDQRIGSLVDLLLKVTDPATIEAIGRLVDRIPQIEQASRLLDEVPNLLAIVTDVFDEFTSGLQDRGVELENSITQGLHALLWLGSRISNDDLERLGDLLRSDVLDPHALEVVGNAATSLATIQRNSCELKTASRVGILGLLQSIRDPNVQRSIGFGIQFAKCFGKQSEESSSS